MTDARADFEAATRQAVSVRKYVPPAIEVGGPLVDGWPWWAVVRGRRGR